MTSLTVTLTNWNESYVKRFFTLGACVHIGEVYGQIVRVEPRGEKECRVTLITRLPRH